MCGKSIFIINLIKIIKNKKILILDFDYSINTILNIKNNNEEKYTIIKYKKNINILNLENININEEIINKLFNEYEMVFIDLTNNIELNKIFIKNNYINIILIEPNLLGIKKSNKILNKYNKYLFNNYKKINIIFNKYNIYSIKINILKIIFGKYKILGKINYNKNYDLLINKNIFKNILNIKLINKIINN